MEVYPGSNIMTDGDRHQRSREGWRASHSFSFRAWADPLDAFLTNISRQSVGWSLSADLSVMTCYWVLTFSFCFSLPSAPRWPLTDPECLAASNNNASKEGFCGGHRAVRASLTSRWIGGTCSPEPFSRLPLPASPPRPISARLLVNLNRTEKCTSTAIQHPTALTPRVTFLLAG